jgi:hypothetical protein
MNHQPDSLEGALHKLAYEFATGLLQAAVHSPIAELSALLRDGATLDHVALTATLARELPAFVARLEPRKPAFAPPPARGDRASAHVEVQSKRQEKSQIKGQPSSERAEKSVVVRPQARPAPSRITRVPVSRPRARSYDALPEPDAADGFESVITDPSLLLGAIAAGPSISSIMSPTSSQATAPYAPPAPSLPSESPRSSRTARGGGFDRLTTEPAPPAAPTAEQGPVLRPGERLQRTAGGNVVLRRGAK